MQYDPVKNKIFRMIRRYSFLRKLFFVSLDLLFLRQWYVKREISRIMKPSTAFRFYDAGAGFCQYSDYILSAWKRSSVLALDLKDDYLKDYDSYARKAYPRRFEYVTSDLVEFVPEGPVDLIAAIDILEHIENDIQVMRNFHSCLTPSGKLVISTPSDKDEAARFTEEHVRPGYSKSEIIAKLTQSGFQIDRFCYSYGPWGKAAWQLAIKQPLQMLSHSYFCVIILPIYYICLYPLIYLFMKIDITKDNQIGNGIVIVAKKMPNAS